ncbi:hypothetical protein ONZ45_g15755 [Pleurotus djamor]|nr:hypothetical protein ONZ45_g15755 [Pleurotus djamor]
MPTYQRLSFPREHNQTAVAAFINRLRRQHRFPLLHRLFACTRASECGQCAVQQRILQIHRGQAPEPPQQVVVPGNRHGLLGEEGEMVVELHYLEPGEYLLVFRRALDN